MTNSQRDAPVPVGPRAHPDGQPPHPRDRLRTFRRPGAVLAAAGLAFVLAATLTPEHDVRGTVALTPLTCLVCGDQGGADVIANLLLFLPLAVGLGLAGLPWRKIVLLSAALSFSIELLQLLVIPGRDASLSDLLANTASGAMGAALAAHLPTALYPSRSRARALLGGGTLAWLMVMSGAAWLLQPAVPDGLLMSRWAHEAPGRDVFDGRVSEVRLDRRGMPPNGPPPDSADLRHRLDLGHFTLVADVTSGRPMADRSWIYMFRVPSGGALTLYQFRRQLGLAVPVRGLRYRLQPVTVTLRDGFPATLGVPVHLEARGNGGDLSLSSTYGGVTRTAELTLSPAYGWRLISPFELGVGAGVRWFTGLVMAASVFPLGYWARRAGPGGAPILAATLATGLIGLPAWAGLPGAHWSEWAAAGLGVVAGWATRQSATYLERRCASPSGNGSSSS